MYHFFTGVGGSGKTTISLASAIMSATKGKKTAFITSDPTVFGVVDLDEGQTQKVTGTLDLFFVGDAEADKFRRNISDFDYGFGETLDVILDYPLLSKLIFLSKINELEGYSEVYIDLSLEMFTMMKDKARLKRWVENIFRLKLKLEKAKDTLSNMLPYTHKESSPMSSFFGMADNVRDLDKVMKKADFTLVFSPSKLSFLFFLKNKDFGFDTIVVNKKRGKKHCDYCQARYDSQETWLKELKKVAGRMKMREVPLYSQEPVGVTQLKKLAESFT